MTEQTLYKEGVLKVVAKTGGLMFIDQDGFWYNCEKDNEELKQIVINSISKGDKVKIGHSKGVYNQIQMLQKAVNSQGSSPVIDDEHIMILQGKKFIKHSGLLDIAHKSGLVAIRTELVSQSPEIVIFKATVEMPDNKLFEAYGDATKQNVNGNILPHILRMAETRAVNRALRFATNIGMTSAEEMGDGNNNSTPDNVVVENVAGD